MIELEIGTRFYYKGKLCEVVEKSHNNCLDCVIMEISDCLPLVCVSKARQDRKNVCFKEVKDE